MSVTSILISVALPVVLALTTTYLVIRFGPERQDLKRLRVLLEQFSKEQEKERIAELFRCDVMVRDWGLDGAELTLTSETPFVLKQIQFANNAFPFRTWDIESGLSTTQTHRIDPEAIRRVWNSLPGGCPQGLILFKVEVNGVHVNRMRAVRLDHHSFQSSQGQTTYIRLQG